MPERSLELFAAVTAGGSGQKTGQTVLCDQPLCRSDGLGRYNERYERCTVSRETFLTGLETGFRSGNSLPPTARHTGPEQASSSRCQVRRGRFSGFGTGHAPGVIFRSQRIHISLFYRTYRQYLHPRIQAICDPPGWTEAGRIGWRDWHNVSLFRIEFLLAGTPEAIKNLSPERPSHV
jgi:hypothetical protein